MRDLNVVYKYLLKAGRMNRQFRQIDVSFKGTERSQTSTVIATLLYGPSKFAFVAILNWHRRSCFSKKLVRR